MLNGIYDRLRQFPMLRITLPLLLGITLEGVFRIPLYNIFLASTFVIFVFSDLYHSHLGYSKRWITGVAFNLFVCAGGYWLAVESREEPPFPDSYSGIFSVKILEMPEERERSFRLKGFLEHEVKNDSLHYIGQELLLYVKKDSGASELKPGDVLLAHLRLQKPAKAMNPGDFDYRNYLAIHGTYYTAFLNISESKKLPNSKGFDLTILLRKIRAHLVQKLPEYGISGKNMGIFAALTLGYTGYIDTDTRNDFVASGAMHILSVSGLHVAIVYLVFSFMLGLTNQSKKYVRIRALVVIGLLWAYAFLTGLPACVLRSTIMFCFVVAARVFKRQANIYNSIAASAFVLLIFDPMLVYDIGFQLSYMALLSIVYFQPKIQGLFSFKSKIWKKAWELTAVAFAAQIATTPISIAIFGQFPVYFWVSNIFVIGISNLLLFIAAPFGVVAYFLPYLGKLFGEGISLLLDLLRYITNFVEQLPGSVITGLNVSAIQASILVLAVVMFGFYLETRKKLSIAVVFLCFTVVIIVDSISVISHKQQQAIAILSVRKEQVVAFINGREATILWRGNALTDSAIAQSLKAPLHHYRIQTVRLISMGDTAKIKELPMSSGYVAGGSILLVSYGGKRVAIQRYKPTFYLKPQPLESKIKVDILLSDTPYLAKIAMNVVTPNTVVFGNKTSQQQLARMPVAHYWPISSNGAYLLAVSQ